MPILLTPLETGLTVLVTLSMMLLAMGGFWRSWGGAFVALFGVSFTAGVISYINGYSTAACLAGVMAGSLA